MHCPSCGQQQASNEIKFCSRCGFPLGLITEILGHGGFLPQLAELHKKKTIFNKKNGVIFGVMWFIAFTMLFTSILGIINAPDAIIGTSAVIGVFGAMMMIIGSVTLLPSSKQYPLITAQQMLPPSLPNAHGLHGAHQQALPGQQSIPATAYAPPRAGSWRDTNDLEPSSVTESTTKLLEKEEKLN
ncbi:MAG TPA: hypothetical protein VGJ02_01225 [Pyrinomonadaceae bacterium]